MKRTLQAMLLALVAIMMPIGAWAQETTPEAKWGASAASLTHEGTLVEAIRAAEESSDVAYIQLQSDVTTDGGYTINGGIFTLDLNGHTLTSDSNNALDIQNDGTSVTLTDNSGDATGKVVCSGSGTVAINLFGASLIVENGSYEATFALDIGTGTAIIIGGTFMGRQNAYTIRNLSGTLSISGGSFGGTDVQASVCAASSSGSTTITGGTFAEASTGTIGYYGGKLDLTGYPTTKTEGTTPLTEISVYNGSGSIAVDATTIALPTGYCFYNSNGKAVTMLGFDKKYTIGAEPDTKYTVTYDANGGSGTMGDAFSYGGDYILPECNFTAPEDKMFKAWLVGDTEYQPGDIITVVANTTVTAVWTDYAPQITLQLTDSFGDGWNGAAITVKKDGEEIGVATIESGNLTATFRYDYDSASAYTFYWTKGSYDDECSFVIKVEDEEVLTTSAGDCDGYGNGDLIHTIGAVGGGEGSGEDSGETTPEAKWGASAESLTHEGTLVEAIRAAEESSDVAYIQLQSSVTTTGDHVIHGGTFTLDLNGHTLTSDGYTLCIYYEGTSVTLTDSSEDGEGKVVSTLSGAAAVDIFLGAHVTIEGGSYESESTAVIIQSGCSATISGGTFLGGSERRAVYNDGTLIISGGTFDGEGIWSSVCAASSLGSTTITGGTFAVGSKGTFEYYGGKLDLTGYPTTETEGTTPLTEVSVDNYVANVTVDVTTIALPTGYCFYNSSEQAVTMLVASDRYTIGEEPDTKYTITFAPDGGSGEMAAGVNYGNNSHILPECTFTAPEGMMFKAWLVGDTEYQPGEAITVTENTTVTAVWTDYVPQIILRLADSYGDGWNGAAIIVKKDGEEIGVATIENGRTATIIYDYDNTCEYTFYWTEGEYDEECSFIIKVEGKTVLTASANDCNGYEDGQLIHTIEAVGGGGTTGMAPSTLNSQHSTIIYDLAGRRVEQPTRGIYIVNGRKVIF